MATKAQVESAIFGREGFRVELELFDGKKHPLPPYEYPVMAPQRWKISDWKNARLDAYRLAVKAITIYRGDGTPVNRDLQLGNLRDSYYEAEYGSSQPPGSSSDERKAARLERPRRLPRKSSHTNGKVK